MPIELPTGALHGAAARLDRSGVVVAANRLFQRLVSGPDGSPSGRLWADLIPEACPESNLGTAIAGALGGRLFGELESNSSSVAGDGPRLIWFGAPTLDSQGAIDGAVIVAEECGGPWEPIPRTAVQEDKLDNSAWAIAIHSKLLFRVVSLVGYGDLLRCQNVEPEFAGHGIEAIHQSAGRMNSMLNEASVRFQKAETPDGNGIERIQLLRAVFCDLNNSMVVLMGFTNLLLEPHKLPPTAQPICEKLLIASQRMTELLRQTYSQMEERRNAPR